MCETWDMTFSNNHHMFSEVDNWLYKYVGGIRLEENGLVIAPVLSDHIKNFKVTHRDISVERKNDILFVTVPYDAILRLNGKTISLPKGKHHFSVLG